MNLPLVSVIIPTYNAAQYVARAVDSALAQTYSPVEVIVVDDGSTDNTVQVLEPYNSKIHYLYQPNAGQAAARNRAIRQSSGDFYAFLDADDMWQKDKLEQQIPVLLSNPKLGLVHSNFDYLDEKTGKTFTISRPRHKLVGRCYTRLFFGCSIFASSVVVRRECLEKIGLFDEQIPPGIEDYDLWLRISQEYEFAYVPRCLAVYRQHSTNISHNALRMNSADLTVIRKALGANPSLWQMAGEDQVKKRLFDLCFGVAYLHFDLGNFTESRRFLNQALRNHPARAYAWMLWLSSFLPGSWIWFLRNVKQRYLPGGLFD
jgi:glycosyltransferase involved in cell wall biosynthesis